MNILDENILDSQREQLSAQGVPFRQIGYEIGRKGMDDEEIIPFLLRLAHPTFFTHDSDFYRRQLTHSQYCIVCLGVRKHEAAQFVRRLLRHPEFKTAAKRMGSVIRASRAGLTVWHPHAEEEEQLSWVRP